MLNNKLNSMIENSSYLIKFQRAVVGVRYGTISYSEWVHEKPGELLILVAFAVFARYSDEICLYQMILRCIMHWVAISGIPSQIEDRIALFIICEFFKED